jgi:predicted ABC-type ATPase
VSKPPKFRLFAGPNGSGKTTLISTIGKDFNLGIFINADILEYNLTRNGFLDLEEIVGKPTPKQSDWVEFFDKYQRKDSRSTGFDKASLKLEERILVWDGEINSCLASIIAAFLRYCLLKHKKSFSFETVMSHPSMLDFISEAKALGYKCYLYFICTDDPSINVQREKIVLKWAVMMYQDPWLRAGIIVL